MDFETLRGKWGEVQQNMIWRSCAQLANPTSEHTNNTQVPSMIVSVAFEVFVACFLLVFKINTKPRYTNTHPQGCCSNRRIHGYEDFPPRLCLQLPKLVSTPLIQMKMSSSSSTRFWLSQVKAIRAKVDRKKDQLQVLGLCVSPSCSRKRDARQAEEIQKGGGIAPIIIQTAKLRRVAQEVPGNPSGYCWSGTHSMFSLRRPWTTSSIP